MASSAVTTNLRARIKGDSYQLGTLQVDHQLGRLPRLQFCFLNTEPHPNELRDWSEDRTAGRLAELNFHINDFWPNHQSRSVWQVEAIAGSSELMDWLKARPALAAGRTLVYQRTEKDVSATSFINRTCGNRFIDFPPALNIDVLFPPEATILRPAGLNNQQFLDLLVAILRLHEPRVMGWTAFHRAEQPLALITTDWPIVTDLGKDWQRVPRERVSSPCGCETAVRSYRKYVNCASEEQLERFITQLCQYGQAPTGIATIASPSVVRIGSRNALCQRVVHSFDASSLRVQVDIEVVDTEADVRSFYEGAGIRKGKFVEWLSDSKGEARLAKLAPSDGRWVMISDEQHETVDENGTLHTWLLTPAADAKQSSDEPDSSPVTSGREFYVQHPVGVTKKVWLGQAGLPGALGEIQHRHGEFEKRPITISGNEVGVVTSPIQATSDQLVGILMNAQQVLIQVDKEGVLEATPGKTRVAHLQVDKCLSVKP